MLLELGLRIFTPFPIHDPSSNRRAHQALGYTLAEDFAEADQFGFRNSEEVADSVRNDIVAIGDSHTYGYNVAATESWPGVLSARTGLSVYNYGMGGYGLLQYRYLFDEALQRAPTVVLVGLFLINDLANFCELADTAFWRPQLDSAGLRYSDCRKAGQSAVAVDESAMRRLVKSTALGSLLVFLKQRYFYWIGRSGLSTTIGQQEFWTDIWRLRAIIRQTDLQNPAVADAKDAAFYFFSEMKEAASSAGVKFGVMLIPSRERVVFNRVENASELSSEWLHAVELESELVQQFSEFFEASKIPYVDGLPFVLEAFDRVVNTPEPFYPVADGHPFSPGYRAYAEAAESLIRQ